MRKAKVLSVSNLWDNEQIPYKLSKYQCCPSITKYLTSVIISPLLPLCFLRTKENMRSYDKMIKDMKLVDPGPK